MKSKIYNSKSLAPSPKASPISAYEVVQAPWFPEKKSLSNAPEKRPYEGIIVANDPLIELYF